MGASAAEAHKEFGSGSCEARGSRLHLRGSRLRAAIRVLRVKAIARGTCQTVKTAFWSVRGPTVDPEAHL
eukprot:1565427-Prymnesium_polylepis.1